MKWFTIEKCRRSSIASLIISLQFSTDVLGCALVMGGASEVEVVDTYNVDVGRNNSRDPTQVCSWQLAENVFFR